MRKLAILPLVIMVFLTSCVSYKEGGYTSPPSVVYSNNGGEITESLFSDKASTISEDNIQMILNGTYYLPEKLKVAVLNIDKGSTSRGGYYSYYSENEYLTSRQKYVDYITDNLASQNRVEKISWIPSMMTGANPTFTSIREAAVRMQADIVIVYSISEGNIYTKHKVFSSEHKAFATTQVMVMDVRTGLIPLTDISTKDYFIPKEEKDNKDNKSFNESEKRKMIQEQAVLLTLQEIGNNINKFLIQ